MLRSHQHISISTSGFLRWPLLAAFGGGDGSLQPTGEHGGMGPGRAKGEPWYTGTEKARLHRNPDVRASFHRISRISAYQCPLFGPVFG